MRAITGIDIEKAAGLLMQGELVSVPTETVYGLAGNALNDDVLLKIYEAKKRPAFDPLIMHLPSLERINDYAEKVPDVFLMLAEKFCPGPLTFVLPKKTIVPDIMTSGLKTVALRIPDHQMTLELLNLLPFPLAAPSANLFGRVSPTSAVHVQQQLGDKIPYILDGGECSIGIESTIITMEDEKIIILRQGGVSMEMISSLCQNIPVLLKDDAEVVVAPGQLKSHYSTKTPMIIGNIEEMIMKYADSKICILSFADIYPQIGKDYQRALSPMKEMNEAAKKLFRYMNELDELCCDFILTEKVPAAGLGRAINDRLDRAAASTD